MLVEHGAGLTVSRDLPKLGYKGVESCELSFDDYRVPASAILGGEPGKGFAQMMKGLETGRIQVASRALGVATAALEDALAYAQERESFGQPIWKHQAIGNYLADMATKLTAARQLTLHAADRYDSGERADMEAGHGQAVRLRGRDGDRAERRAHPRRLRLLHRVRRRTLLPRRPADDRRRGHQRDPAQRHRRRSWSPAAGSEVGECDPRRRIRYCAQQLRDEIAAGVYRDGARLPTESELVARHGCRRQTVRRAFQDLVAEGMVYRVPGRGTYASESGRRYLRQLGSIEDLMSLSDDTTMEVLSGLRRRVDVDAASRLRLDDDVVYTVVFRRLHDGVPFVVTRVHLPEAVAPAVLDAPELADGAVEHAHRHRTARAAPGRADRRSGAVDYGRAGRRWRVADAVGCEPAIRCCGWTGCTPMPPARPSSCRSATSCPSSTPTG